MITGVVVEQMTNGKWAAWTMHSPYFRFEGDSEEEVIALGGKALAAHRDFLAAMDAVTVTPEMIKAGCDHPRTG